MWKSCWWMPRRAACCPMVVTAYYWSSQRTFAKFWQSRRKHLLLGPSPCWKCIQVLPHLIQESTTQSNAPWLWKLRGGSLRSLLIIVGHSALATEECVSLWFVMKTICHIPRIWAENIYIKTLTVNVGITRINICPFKYSDTSCIFLCKQAAWHEMT